MLARTFVQFAQGLFTEMLRGQEPVEKVAADPINAPDPGSKRPTTGLSALKAGVIEGHKEIFQQTGSFLVHIHKTAQLHTWRHLDPRAPPDMLQVRVSLRASEARGALILETSLDSII